MPTCRSVPVDLAHIVPWSIVREHRFENLIALCPTCHRRFDGEDIDRKAMLIYKASLKWDENVATLLGANRLAAYLDFRRQLSSWCGFITRVELFDVAGERDEQTRRALVQECTAEAAEAKRALICFVVTCKRETARKAELVYGTALVWANDVVDGLWPSTHPGADRHAEDLPEADEELLLVLADDIGMMADELDGLANGYGIRLGGTGKRY
ncbi:HNH endonuclease signature motif containing protein [Verrucosispora sp. TAA-831]|uniref:HNH endonuclease signature motif containing protein n=1 Tax=Verrucosispora sp. TAA-831 TaxID=3422227 RepID=UPI003D701317